MLPSMRPTATGLNRKPGPLHPPNFALDLHNRNRVLQSWPHPDAKTAYLAAVMGVEPGYVACPVPAVAALDQSPHPLILRV